MFSLRFIPSVYDIKAVHVMCKAVFTNNAPMGPYRGAGRPEANYLIERLVEKAARITGIDAIAADLKAKGVKFTREPTTVRPGTRVCFIEGPQGVSIELLDRTV